MNQVVSVKLFFRSVPGLVLLVAAVLKLISASSVPVNFQLLEPLKQLLLVEAELLLGIILICGFKPRGTKLIGLLVFIGFSIYSAVLMAMGVQVCGCFGSVQVPPNISLFLDVVCILLLSF